MRAKRTQINSDDRKPYWNAWAQVIQGWDAMGVTQDVARFRENRARNSGNWAQMKDDTGVVGATQGKGRIPWDPRGRVRSTAARRAAEAVLLGVEVVDVVMLSSSW